MLLATAAVQICCVAAAAAVSRAVPDPADMAQLECSIHQLAFEFGTSLVSSSPQALHDALNLGNCSAELGEATLRANRRRLAIGALPVKQWPAAESLNTHAPRARSTFYVSTAGSDSGAAAGTLASPFATLQRAAAAARAAPKPVAVWLRGGKCAPRLQSARPLNVNCTA